MGEAVLRKLAPGLEVSSAGIAALVGRPADPLAVALLAERGIDLTRHRARQLTASMVEEVDLVLVMEKGHVAEVEAMTPAARGRVHLLGRFGRYEIADPFRKPRKAFEESLELIERGLADYVNRFWSRS
jgi:protein-tyrosine phosphatase